jgi:hypothetical protein
VCRSATLSCTRCIWPRVASIWFDLSGQATSKELSDFLDGQGIHHEVTVSGTRQEMPVAEQSNATFAQGTRSNLAAVRSHLRRWRWQGQTLVRQALLYSVSRRSSDRQSAVLLRRPMGYHKETIAPSGVLGSIGSRPTASHPCSLGDKPGNQMLPV